MEATMGATSDELARLAFARQLADESRRHIRAGSDFNNGLAISLMQDACELMLRLAIKHFDLKVRPTATFDELISVLDSAVTTVSRVPHTSELQTLNKARVNFKHFGLAPLRDDAVRLCTYGEVVLKECSDSYFSTNFDDLSPIDAVRNEKARDFLKDAANALAKGEVVESLTKTCLAYGAVAGAMKDHFPVVDPSLTRAANAFSDANERKAIDAAMRFLVNYLAQLRESIIFSELAIEPYAYAEFRRRSPTVVVSYGGEVTTNLSREYTQEDARFCLDFVFEVARRMDMHTQR
jgi:hypothetical protein